MSALSVTAGVRPFPLAMQHFYSFVSKVISLLFVSQVRCLHCWCPPFSAGHAAFLFTCLPFGLFTFVSQVRCLHCWHPPFSLYQHFYSCVSQAISVLPCPPSVRLVSLCLPSCCHFLLVTVSALSPLWVIVSVLSLFCFLLSPFLCPFLLVIVSVLSPFLSPFVSGLVSLLGGHCVRLVSLMFPFVFLLVSVLVCHWVRLVSFLFLFVLLLVSVLVCHCVRLVSLLFPFVSLLSPFLLAILSVVSPFCFLLSPFLSPFLLMSRKVDLGMLRCCPTCLGSTRVYFWFRHLDTV